MNWYKTANNTFSISYSQEETLTVSASNGKIYIYYGIHPKIIRLLRLYIRKELWGNGWQLLNRVGPPETTIDPQKNNNMEQKEFDF